MFQDDAQAASRSLRSQLKEMEEDRDRTEGRLQQLQKSLGEVEEGENTDFYPQRMPVNPSAAEVTFVQCTEKAKKKENRLNPVMLVFIGKLSPSAIR